MQGPIVTHPTAYTVGIDIGGTRIKSGAISSTGQILATDTRPTGFIAGPESLLTILAETVAALARQLATRPQAVAFGMPGLIDPAQGVAYLPVRILNLEGFPLVPRLAERLGVPVVAESDGRLMILAERAFGLARDVEWAVCVAMGTGLGTAVLLDGQILRDPTGAFGTLGAFAVIAGETGPRCFSGARGTAESLCSATALSLAARSNLERGVASSLAETFQQNPAAIDFQAVTDAARQGDEMAQDCVDVWSTHLSHYLITLAQMYTPQRIILCGGGSLAADLYIDKLREAVGTRTFRDPRGPEIEVVVSEMRDQTGMLGAGALAWELANPRTQF